jgi:hypothetical protein
MVVFLDIVTSVFKVSTQGTLCTMMHGAKINKKFFSSKHID